MKKPAYAHGICSIATNKRHFRVPLVKAETESALIVGQAAIGVADEEHADSILVG